MMFHDFIFAGYFFPMGNGCTQRNVFLFCPPDADQTVDPEAKLQADDSSDFKALLALASSELDHQRNLKRKRDGNETSSAKSDNKTSSASKDLKTHDGPSTAKWGKSHAPTSNAPSNPGHHGQSSGKNTKTHHSHSGGSKHASSSKREKPSSQNTSTSCPGPVSSAHGACGKSARSPSPSPAPAQHKNRGQTVESPDKPTAAASKALVPKTCKQEKKQSGEEQVAPSSSKASQQGTESDAKVSSDASRSVGKEDRGKGSSSKSKLSAKERKPHGISTKEPQKSEEVNKSQQQKHETAGDKHSPTERKDQEKDLTKKSNCPHSHKAISSRSSAKVGEREARLDKHQRKSFGSSATEGKPSSSFSTAAPSKSSKKEESKAEERGGKHCAAVLEKKHEGKRDGKESSACTPSHSPRPKKAGDHEPGKDATRTKESPPKASSLSPTPKKHSNKQEISPSSKAAHQKETPPCQPSSSSPKPEHRRGDKHKKSSPRSQTDSPTAKSEIPRTPSSSPKPENRGDKHRKPSPSNGVSGIAPKKEASHASSSSPKPESNKGEKHRNSSPSSQRSTPAPKVKAAHTPSTSPKPENRHSEKRSSGHSSPVPSKDTALTTTASAASKDEVDDKDRKTSNSRNNSPVPKKETSGSSTPSKSSSSKPNKNYAGKDWKKTSSSQSKPQEGKADSARNPSPLSHRIKIEGKSRLHTPTKDKQDSSASKKSSSTSPSPSASQGPQKSTTKHDREGYHKPANRAASPCEKRPAFEQQVSLGFSQEDTQEVVSQDASQFPSPCPSPSSSVRKKLQGQKNASSLAGSGQKVDQKESVASRNGSSESSRLPPVSDIGGRVDELKSSKDQRPSRSCTSSPQLLGTRKARRQSSSAPSSRTSSPVARKDESQPRASRSTVSHSMAQPAVKLETSRHQKSSSTHKTKVGLVTASSLFPAKGEAPASSATPAGKGAGLPVFSSPKSPSKVDRALCRHSPKESSSVARERVSPTKTVTVTLKDIAPSLKESGSMGSYFVDSPVKRSSESPTIRSPDSSFPEKPRSPTLWRGPRTPPGSPAQSDLSSRQSRRDSHISSTSSSSSGRSSTSSSVSSSTSRGRSTSSGQSGGNRQKSPRKNRANARRRSLRSYSSSTTTTATSSSSEEESDSQTTKQGHATSKTTAAAGSASPAPASPLFGPLIECEKKQNLAKELTSAPSELSPSSTDSSSASPVDAVAPKDSQTNGGALYSQEAALNPGLTGRVKPVHAAACQQQLGPRAVDVKTEQPAAVGKYPGPIGATKGQQSMTHISSRSATTTLPLPDLTKPPPALYTGLSGYPSPPLPAPRPGYLPIGSPPTVVTVAPGYISHSPNTPSQNTQPPMGMGKYSQYRSITAPTNNNNNNNNKVGSWGPSGHGGSIAGPSSPFSANPPPPPPPPPPPHLSSDGRGLNPPYYQQPSAAPMPILQQALLYPTGQAYSQSNSYKYQHAPVPGRASRAPRLYSPGTPHSWHPYSRGPPLNNGGMRRQ